MKETNEYMQVKIFASGDEFKPESLIGKYNPMELEIVASPGTLRKKGRYKGHLSLNGICCFTVPSDVEHEEKINMATTLVNRLKQDKSVKIDDVHVHLFFSGIQGNMELTTEELKSLAGFGTTVSIDYIDSLEASIIKSS
jgi:hypothetical protein